MRRKKQVTPPPPPPPQPASPTYIDGCHFEAKGPGADVTAAVQAIAEACKEAAKALQGSQAPMLLINQPK